MGLDSNAWGRHGWGFIHAVALGFPEDPTEMQIKAYKDFFYSLQITLPCPFCANNFKKKIKEIPPVFTNASSLFNWTVDIHNQVNRDLGKPELSYEQAFREFSSSKGKKMSLFYPVAGIIFAFGAGVVLTSLLQKKK